MTKESTKRHKLIHREKRSMGDNGLMRAKAAHWRDRLGEPDEIIYELVRLENGTQEIRIRASGSEQR